MRKSGKKINFLILEKIHIRYKMAIWNHKQNCKCKACGYPFWLKNFPSWNKNEDKFFETWQKETKKC